VLHSTKGVDAAAEHLTAAAKRAQLGLAARCRAKGINDFSLCTRLHRAPVKPILTFGAEVWAPHLLPTLGYALASPFSAPRPISCAA
jgi:hypothetical protein